MTPAANISLHSKGAAPECAPHQRQPPQRGTAGEKSKLGRAVVQPGRTLAWGARGREFESRQPDQFVDSKPRGYENLGYKQFLQCVLGLAHDFSTFWHALAQHFSTAGANHVSTDRTPRHLPF